MKVQKGFTLAEVLITLGIIGVVAALTLPTLIQKYQEKVTVVKLKKMYSVLTQTYTMYLKDNEPEWFSPQTEEGAIGVSNVFKPYLKISKDCGLNDYSCIYTGKYKMKDGREHQGYGPNLNNNNKYYKVKLADGATIMFRGGAPANPLGYLMDILYDTNGPKAPNKWGEDLFEFYVYGNRLAPSGHPNIPSENQEFEEDCAPNTNAAGYACAAWVILNENMDYLHCSDLSWHGKTKCN